MGLVWFLIRWPGQAFGLLSPRGRASYRVQRGFCPCFCPCPCRRPDPGAMLLGLILNLVVWAGLRPAIAARARLPQGSAQGFALALVGGPTPGRWVWFLMRWSGQAFGLLSPRGRASHRKKVLLVSHRDFLWAQVVAKGVPPAHASVLADDAMHRIQPPLI